MSNLRAFKQRLATIAGHWELGDYDTALNEVAALREIWPGNSHLHVLWSSLVQLQNNPTHSLDEVKQALQQAVALDPSATAASLELGLLLDNVFDNPRAAAKVYAEGVAVTRHLLVEGLIGQAKALLQLGKREEARHCLLEVGVLLHFVPADKTSASSNGALNILDGLPLGLVFRERDHGPFAEQLNELLHELTATRSAS